MLFGVQERTYVARVENVKISFSLSRKQHFGLPRGSQNPSKIDQKSILTASYVEVVFFFNTHKNLFRSAPEAILYNFIRFWAAMLGPSSGQKRKEWRDANVHLLCCVVFPT